MKKHTSIRLWLILFLSLCLLPGGAVLTVGADDVSEIVRKSIDKTFPECEIKEIEEEKWQGEVVTEVELIAKDGTLYEVYISKEGKVLKIEKEDGFPWFSKKRKKDVK